jgi:hypothetical protein
MEFFIIYSAVAVIVGILKLALFLACFYAVYKIITWLVG